MKLVFISIGKTKDKNLANLQKDYFERIKRYYSCEILEIREDKNISSKDVQKIIKSEGEKLGKSIAKGNFNIAFDEKGKEFNTHEFANFLSKTMNSGYKRINFIIGGPFGLSDEVKKKADRCVALSKMTLPHELAKTVSFEQIYRAITIIKGQKYHY